MPKKIQNFAKSALVKPITINVGRAGAASLDVIQVCSSFTETCFCYLRQGICLVKLPELDSVFCFCVRLCRKWNMSKRKPRWCTCWSVSRKHHLLSVLPPKVDLKYTNQTSRVIKYFMFMFPGVDIC